jgi:type I restriction enzyme S subunit
MANERWHLLSSWRWAQLDELSEVISKGTTPTTFGVSFASEGIPFLRAEDINGGAVDVNLVKFHINYETHSGVLRRSQLQSGDLLITIAGTLGRVGYVPGNIHQLNCNQAVAFVRLKSDLIHLPFACFALQYDQVIAGLVDRQKVATIGNLNLEQIREFSIPLPPLPEQQRIAAILAKADRLRRLRRYTLDLGESYLQSVFWAMFGDSVTNPQRWELSTLGDEIEGFEAGINFPPIAEGEKASSWRVLKISAVTWGDFDPKESKPISQSSAFNELLKVRKGDLLISRANTTELVGAVSMVRHIPPKVLLPDKLWRICFRDNSKLLPDYTLIALRQPSIRKIIGDLATGSSGSMKNISMDKASTIPITLPPLPLQQKFTQIVHQYERLRAQQREAVRQAEHLFQALLQRAFAGGVSL